jgi:hypothetical protein
MQQVAQFNERLYFGTVPFVYFFLLDLLKTSLSNVQWYSAHLARALSRTLKSAHDTFFAIYGAPVGNICN